MTIRNAVIVLFSIWTGIFAVSCAGSDRSHFSARSASGQVIMKTMERGLLGIAFDSMSRNERRNALEAEYKSLEYAKAGETVIWKAEEGLTYGSVIAGQAYRVGSQNCRQYSHGFVLNGIPHSARGSACRNPDGSWVPLI